MFSCFQNIPFTHFVLMLLLYRAFLVQSSTDDCSDIQACQEIDELPLGGLTFRVNINNKESQICPRTDSPILHWEVSSQESSSISAPPLEGSYCSVGEVLPPSSVCVNDGTTLTFVNLEDYRNTSGTLKVKFNGSSVIPIVYGPTGIIGYPDSMYLLSNEGSVPLTLTWYMYSQQQVMDHQVVFNGAVVATEASSAPGHSEVFCDTTLCQATTGSEVTEVCTLHLIEPSASSVGEYTLIGGTFSGVVTVVLDSSYVVVEPSPSVVTTAATVMAVSSVIIHSSSSTTMSTAVQSELSSSPSSSPISSATSSSATVSESPSSSAGNSSASLLTITLVLVIVGVAFSCIVLLVLLVGLYCRSTVCRDVEKGRGTQDTKDTYRKKISVVHTFDDAEPDGAVSIISTTGSGTCQPAMVTQEHPLSSNGGLVVVRIEGESEHRDRLYEQLDRMEEKINNVAQQVDETNGTLETALVAETYEQSTGHETSDTTTSVHPPSHTGEELTLEISNDCESVKGLTKQLRSLVSDDLTESSSSVTSRSQCNSSRHSPPHSVSDDSVDSSGGGKVSSVGSLMEEEHEENPMK